ncbi:hypothetical protein GRX03_00230 [Halovenus sp. WSH3]|uniref:Phasin family protein n=1 Tax=Halovenus carboxidivorans TaxID=2692199 RepID=A0A6B0SXW2_9EURY|nr:hypothetical protein [Halovenus carboxidivorans]MXR50037.1 hypothetical protein [Halovenus carboxidivorans]
MSEYQTPIGPLFELQRETLKRGADLLELPRSVHSEVTAEGLSASEEAGRQLLELGRGSVHRSLAVAECVQGSTDNGLHGTVDTVFDGLREQQGELYTAVEQSHERTERAAMTRGAEQLTIALDLNRTLEAQLVGGLEELDGRGGDVAAELTERIEALGKHLDGGRRRDRDQETRRRPVRGKRD